MNYQVLARKWRPKKFSDIIGQQHIIKAITHSFQLNKIHHAYIFSGMRGVGKTTIGRLFAKGLNCNQGLTSDVCGQCQNCLDIELGCFIDLIEIDAASKTKVEDTRDFLDNIQYLPYKGRYKVYLIDEVHMLSRHSFNALLKTLEEPPSHVKFILVTTEHQKLPITVISRCLQFYLKPLSICQILNQLSCICNAENITADVRSLELIAYTSQGSMRDALNLLEQAILLGNNSVTSDVINNMFGLIHIERSLLLIENLIDGDINNIINQIDNYSDLGINWDLLFNEILIVLQKIAINQFISHSFKEKIDNDITYIETRIYDIGNRITPEHIQLYYQIFLLGRQELPYAPSYRMGMEMTMLRALAFYPMKKDHINSNNHFQNDDQDLFSGNFFYKNCSKEQINNLQNDNNIKNTIISKQLVSIDHDNASEKVGVYNNIVHDDITNVHADFKKKIQEPNNLIINNAIHDSKSSQIVSNITSKVLKARLKLIEYKKNHNKTTNQSNIHIVPPVMAEKIFEHFSNIQEDISKNNLCDKKKIKI